MSQYDDDFDGPDESEDTDPTIRELRAEIVRLEAQLDQLAASVRERTEEFAVLQAQLMELQAHVTRLEARRRRDEQLLTLLFALAVLSLATTIYMALTM
jgi:septal ring factor EnvC (AmiA/AmiB activator)